MTGPLTKVISGGQTGADRGGLNAAACLGLTTGGWAPPHFRTEAGPDPSLRLLGLCETVDQDYVDRTRLNAHDADVTLWFGQLDTPGYKATRNACATFARPFIENPDLDTLRAIQQTWEVVNVAGNRESRTPGIEQHVMETLLAAWSPQ